jgi:hypothetical protein
MTMPDPVWWEHQVTEMALARCERHDISSCADCRQPVAVTFPARYPHDWEELSDTAAYGDQRGKWISSQYDGNCRACGERWEAGDLIRFDPEEQGWVCYFCGSAEIT